MQKVRVKKVSLNDSIEKMDIKIKENPSVLAVNGFHGSEKAPLCMATTCCSILPLPFTGRHVPSRPGRGTTKEREETKLFALGAV